MNEARIVLSGRAVAPTGMLSVQLDLAAGDEWVYAERVGGVVQVWSGKACTKCLVEAGGLRRCQLHMSLVLVALQLRMID